jgi:pilus assembly protein CpaE
MASAYDTKDAYAELAGAVPNSFEPGSYSGGEVTSIPRATPSESSHIREATASGPHESLQEMKARLDALPQQSRSIAPVPRIAIHAFCESQDVISILERSASDRIMSRATVDIFPGGIRAGVEFYQHNPAPNLIIIESRSSNDSILTDLNELAEFCDPGTRVMVIGYSNDIHFYRELMQRGISEYVVAPISAASLVASISGIYQDPSARRLGQVYAFVGTKGGVGSSTIAHNVGWTLARTYSSDVVLADLDLPFGTAGLNFNVDPHQGIAEAIQDLSRLDEVLLDRLLTKCDDHFSLLTAPGTLEASYDLDAGAFARLLEVAQNNVPFTILDVPHLWTSWARNALLAADEIVITAVPDLANLRNTKNLVDFLKQARPHDAPPKLVLNQVGMAKRPEIKPNEFARALQLEPLACIPFDAQLFGSAANNGKMIANTSAKSPVVQSFSDIVAGVAGRKEPKKEQRGIRNLLSLLRQGKPKS